MKIRAALSALCLLACAGAAQAGPAIYFHFGGGGCYRPPVVVCRPVVVCQPVPWWGVTPWWGSQLWISPEYTVITTRPAPSLAPAGTFRVPPPLHTSAPGATFHWR